MTPSIWRPEPKVVIPPGLRRPIFPGERGWHEAYRLAGLVNGGMVNSGHAMVDAGIIRSKAAGIDTSGLVSYYKMEEATAATRNDSKGSNNLADVNSVAQVTGKISNGAGFTRASSMKLRSSSGFAFGNTTSFSTTGWVNFTSLTSPQGIYSYNDGAGAWSWRMIAFLNGADFVVRMSLFDGTSIGNVTSTAALSTATWYFVFAAYDLTNSLLKISVNDGTVITAAWSTGFETSASKHFEFGSLVGNSNYLDATLDEWGIWNVLLTPAQVTTLYNSGSGFQPI